VSDLVRRAAAGDDAAKDVARCIRQSLSSRRSKSTLASAKPLSPAELVLTVDGQEVARTTVKRTVPAAFSASETFNVGIDLGSQVSLDYFDRRPFRFDGKINTVAVQLK
jgi:hypothetical protein